MKIFINTSNIRKGGALQVAHSFLTEIKGNKEDVFYVILSDSLYKLIKVNEYPLNFSFFNYTIKPNIVKAITGRDKFLDEMIAMTKPSVVFTIFGPSYWIPNIAHFIGYAIPHYIYLESPFYNIISFRSKLRLILLKSIHKYNFKKANAHFCVETEDVRIRLTKFLEIDKKVVHTISNTYNSVFSDYLKNNGLKSSLKINNINDINTFKFITITSDYPHKNLEILNLVVPFLKLNGVNCKFYFTLKNEAFKKYNSNSEYIINLGPIDIEKCPSLYSQVDALFLPTLLECFSASYPEAMIMGKPILTSDLPFAHDICGKAAEFFDPLNPEDIANKIKRIVLDQERREYLIQEGYEQVKIFETSKSRAEKYLEICKSIGA